MITYRAMLDVPRALTQYVGRLLRNECGARRDSRALTCFHQAVFGLRWFRDNRDIAALARDHGISRATSPVADWVSLARGFGVQVTRAGTMDELATATDAAMAAGGPTVFEVLL